MAAGSWSMPDLLPVSLGDQIAELERELRVRRVVYPGWIEARRISRDAADLQVRRMEEALATVQWVKRMRARQ